VLELLEATATDLCMWLLPVMSLMVDVLVAGGDSPRNYSVRWCSLLQCSVMCSVPSVVVFPHVL
jgi:hypothetical protein